MGLVFWGQVGLMSQFVRMTRLAWAVVLILLLPAMSEIQQQQQQEGGSSSRGGCSSY